MDNRNRTRILAVRHGDIYDSPGGKKELYGNRPHFYWLNPLGIKQAKASGAFIAEHYPLDVVVYSPRERTRQTAEIIVGSIIITGSRDRARYVTEAELKGEELPRPEEGEILMISEEEIRDIVVEPWEGTDRAVWTRDRMKYWELQLQGELEGVQTPQQTQARMVGAFNKYTSAYPIETIAFISHGDLICHLLQHFREEPLAPLTEYSIIPYGQIEKASVWGIRPDEEDPKDRVMKFCEYLEYGDHQPARKRK